MATIPVISVTLRDSSAQLNTQPLYSQFHVVGLSSLGVDETSYTINNAEDARARIGYGEGPAFVVEIGQKAGYPIYFTKTKTTTLGTTSTVVKTLSPTSVGTPTSIGALNAGVTYTANQSGVTVAQINTGMVTATTTVAVVLKAISVTLRSSAMAILATADEIRAAVAASPAAMALLAGVANTGDGSGVGVAAGATALPFGSSGTMTVSGTPFDNYILLQTQIVRSGTVGGSPNPTFIFAVDGERFSSEAFIPATGIVALKDSKIDTGLTVTFTGVLAAGDIFTIPVVGPKCGDIDLLNAMDIAIANPTGLRPFGALTTATVANRALANSVDSKLQDPVTFQNNFITGLLGARKIADGVPGETEDQWIDALSINFLGFQSNHGLLQVTAGYGKHNCTYTNRFFNRPIIFGAAARRGWKPVHEALFKTASGTIDRFLSIDHDERLKVGLINARFVTTMTYANRPGQFYFSSGVTMADPGSVDYTRQEIIDILMEICRRAKDQAFIYIGDNFQISALGDPKNQAVPGSLFLPNAKQIAKEMSAVVDSYLFDPKKDAKVSASPFPSGEDSVTVPLNYSYADTHEIRMIVGFYPAPTADKVSISVGVNRIGA